MRLDLSRKQEVQGLNRSLRENLWLFVQKYQNLWMTRNPSPHLILKAAIAEKQNALKSTVSVLTQRSLAVQIVNVITGNLHAVKILTQIRFKKNSTTFLQ